MLLKQSKTRRDDDPFDLLCQFLDLVDRAHAGKQIGTEIEWLVMDMRERTGRPLSGPRVAGLFFSPDRRNAVDTNSAPRATAGER